MFNTKLISINPKDIHFNEIGEASYCGGEFPKEFLEACKYLNSSNGLIGLPTETVYGLGANALDTDSISKIYKAKGRPSDNPLIVHISSLKMLNKILPNGVPSVYEEVIKKYWPGPLTILLPRSELIPLSITAGQSTVAIRFPSHPVARAIIEKADVPIAAPSANLSGKPSPTLASHVLDDLDGKLEYIIDAGACDFGLESTVLDGLSQPPILLRPGAITLEQIQTIKGFENSRVYKRELFTKEQSDSIEQTPTTPGMKYQHYSPDAKVILFDPRENKLLSEKIEIELKEISNSNNSSNGNKLKIAILTKENISNIELVKSKFSDLSIFYEYIGLDVQDVAKNMFAKLREMDKLNMDYILMQGVLDKDLGTAVMNRLRKAASKIIDY
ncbi:translation factor [Neoconidiobolus thromboides FSU 785]|nr:translation factor [Neoconidiobolus thromboides FSU 785]